MARSDLWVVGTRAVHEYDGEHHLHVRQQGRDLRRAGRLADVGLDRRGYTADDVLHHAVGILRDADRALGRPHDPARVRPWHDELRRSLFTPSGRAALVARLGGTPVGAPVLASTPRVAGNG